MSEALLADTHVLVWYFESTQALADRDVRRLNRALESGALFAASFSLREISMLVARRRLTMTADVAHMARRAQRLGLGWLPLDEETSIESARLPGIAPRDPGDQMIVATARVHGLTLATRDGAILDYAAAGHVRVMPV